MTTKAKFIQFLESKSSLEEDRWGNFKSKPNGITRYKIGKTSVRLERKIKLVDSPSYWLKAWSAYYKYIEILDNGKMHISKKM